MVTHWSITIPSDRAPALEHECYSFTEWLDNLEHGGICAHVFRNSSDGTAALLSKAHPVGTVIALLVEEADVLTKKDVERMHNHMETISRLLQYAPYRALVLVNEEK